MITARHLEIAAELLRDPIVPPSDRLPYSPEMDELRVRFSTLYGREVSHREVWEASVGARKRGMVGSSRRRRHATPTQI